MIFVGIVLFNYVNSTMFWHSHIIDGRVITHSHVNYKTHPTGDGGHNYGQLKLLDVISHIVCTDSILPDFMPGRFDVLEYVLSSMPPTKYSFIFSCLTVLRGPPCR